MKFFSRYYFLKLSFGSVIKGTQSSYSYEEKSCGRVDLESQVMCVCQVDRNDACKHMGDFEHHYQ